MRTQGNIIMVGLFAVSSSLLNPAARAGGQMCDPTGHAAANSKGMAISFCENGEHKNGGNLTGLTIDWDPDVSVLTATRHFQIRSCSSASCYYRTHYTVSGEIDIGSPELELTHLSDKSKKLPVRVVFIQDRKNLLVTLPNKSAGLCPGTGGASSNCPFYGAGLFRGGDDDRISTLDDDIPDQRCSECLDVSLEVKFSRQGLQNGGLLLAGHYAGMLELKVHQAKKSSNINGNNDSGKESTILLYIDITVPPMVQISHLDDVFLESPDYKKTQSICVYCNDGGKVDIVVQGLHDGGNHFWLSPSAGSGDCGSSTSSCIAYSMQFKQKGHDAVDMDTGKTEKGFSGSTSYNCLTGDNMDLIIDTLQAKTMPVDTYTDTLSITLSPE